MSKVISFTKMSLTKPTDTLEIYVMGFENTENVKIELFEVHGKDEEYTKGGDTEGDLIATFSGKIEKKDSKCFFKLNGNPVIEKYDNKVTFSSKVKLKFEEDKQVHTLDIPFAHAEREGDTLEFIAKLEAGTTKLESGQAKVASLEKKGIILSFISGTDGGDNPYFKSALTYWKYRHRCDKYYSPQNLKSGTKTYLSLSDIVEMIEEYKKELDKTNSKLPENDRKKIKQINIVAHGSPNGINLMPGKGIKGSGTHNNRIDALNAAKIFAELSGKLSNVSQNQFSKSDKVEIVIRGCNIGENEKLLKEFKSFWGNNVTVYAPKHVQMYRTPAASFPLKADNIPYEFFVSDYTMHLKNSGTLVSNKDDICDAFLLKYNGYSLPQWKKHFDDAKNDKSKLFEEEEEFKAIVQMLNGLTDEQCQANYWVEQTKANKQYVAMRDKPTDWNWGSKSDTIGIRYQYDGEYVKETEDEIFTYTATNFSEYPKEDGKEYPPAPGAPTEGEYNGIHASKYTWKEIIIKDKALQLYKTYKNVKSRKVELRIDIRDGLGHLIMPNLGDPTHYGKA